MKNNYSRKCIVTNEIVLIDKLLRFVKTKENHIFFDKNKEIKGRGSYVKNDLQIVELLFEKKLLNRAFKQNITKEVYEKLKKEIEEYYGEKN
ncbi:YlxR family protein [Mesomycoplasma lagogenitalium]|uniref:YlxR family protein n=1 Tax=Mesomycoplasma lagogenitalium TaxID=171286 RepID=A0ABY8LT04_9BACT|nr:YlxR family protein [Mesomycoplasma lagogenitalium]WGI36380.1 YlxR family protein [Mesomycoplasma lagogenitalium]